MSFVRIAIATGLALGVVSLAACSSSKIGKAGESVDTAAVESELKLSGTRYLGRIEGGESKTSFYSSSPRYRSYIFDAKAGDRITVDVTSSEGDAVGFITNDAYDVLALNDDASSATLDSKVTYTIPADQAPASYRVVYRDYDLLEASFTVKLTLEASAPVECNYGGKTYSSAQGFASIDGCNTCTCSANGVACTKRACVCNPENEPLRNYVGNVQECMTKRYTCPSNMRSFSNSCGCGCEPI